VSLVLHQVFQNEHFAVVQKPAGVLSVAGRTGLADPRPVLGPLLQAQIGKRVWPVHRLDVEVSGLVLFALNTEAHRAGSLWFEHHQIQKTYEALSASLEFNEFISVGAEQTWECLLLRGKKRAYEGATGKPSLTKAILRGPHATLPFAVWELRPVTGRSHQLRYEMFRHQHPIVGDVLYGSLQKCRDEVAIALAAVKLDFPQEAQTKWGLPAALSLPANWTLLF